jgi:hypothetical protein
MVANSGFDKADGSIIAHPMIAERWPIVSAEAVATSYATLVCATFLRSIRVARAAGKGLWRLVRFMIDSK